MSKNKKVTEEKTEEKVVTKYDRKLQRRKEEKEREQREKRMTTIISFVVLIALVCLVASFPIRTYLSLHGTFVTIGGENLTQVEFDYNYNVVMKNYVDAYGEYLSYFGLDTSQDLATQQYDDTLSWKDYFQEMTADNLIRSKSLKADAQAAGFVYDSSEDYAEFEENVKKAASDAGMSLNDYVKNLYGPLATMKRIEPYVKEALMVTAYYEKITEDKLPTQEEIQNYYNENTDDYDSVDYRVVEILAELPTEPTDLADPVEDAEDGEAEDEDSVYEPSEAEITKAMEDAKALAEEAEKTIKTDGELKENVKQDSAVYLIRDWLFESGRKKGDTTILEDTTGNKYYVLAFENRYLDETPSANLRIVMTTEDGQAILDEWKAGEATEESFAALCDKYSVDTSTEGGLYENITKTGLNENLASWVYAEERKAGDVEIIAMNETYNYIVYFIGQGRPEWQIEIESTLSDETMTAYVEEISADCQVVDAHDNLPYIKKREAQEAAEAESQADEEAQEDSEEASQQESAEE
ncbi:MAG: hypothetical protein NC081_00810 [Roseburia sp.]|nr:hypothetical protein [Roseburia sp.]